MDNPTRAASARAIFLEALGLPLPPRIMKKSAVPKLVKMPTNAKITRYVMSRIIW